MLNFKDITVGIVTFKSEKVIFKCLKSLEKLNNSKKTKITILIIDNTVSNQSFDMYENGKQDKIKPSGLVEQAVRFYQKNLNNQIAEKAIQYLKNYKKK